MNKIKETKSQAPVLAAIFFSVFLALIGTSTVNIAIPVLMREFGSSLNTVNWTITGFMLAAGVAAPFSGYMGKRIGNKKVCSYSIIGFTLASLLCSFAWNIPAMIIFRIIQGSFSGLIVPVTMTIIYQSFPKQKQAFAISLWGLAAMLVPAFGPTLSGWLIDTFSWRAIFLINIPVGIFTVLLIEFFVLDDETEGQALFDGPGAVLGIVASVLLLIAFSQGSSWGWTTVKTLGLIFIGLIMLIMFFRHEKATSSPMLNLEVFRYKKYSISIIVASIITIALYSGSLLAPLFLQSVQRLSALDTGLILLPSSLIMALVMPVVGKLYNYTGPKPLILGGIVLLALGSWKLSFLTVETSTKYISAWMIIRSLGISLSMVPATNAGMEVIPPELSGSASSVSNWVRQGLACLSLGVFASMLSFKTEQNITALSIKNPTNRLIPLEAFTISVNDIFIISAVIVMLAIPFSLMFRKERVSV